MAGLRFGIVGSGLIAGVIADAIKRVGHVDLVAVASRRPHRAEAFAEEYQVPQAYATWRELVAADDVDAVYVATPTAVREEICIAAAQRKKHLLADKPFASYESLRRITAAARDNGVAFMDATHFVHNPRSRIIQQTIRKEIGEPRVVRTSFFFPFLERDNIRFDPQQEPTGAVGDMGWYCMRAVTEYLKPDADISSITGGIVRDEETGAVVRGAGVVIFRNGKTSTFDFGYDAGVCVMDLDIIGDSGMLHLDDFVLDWKHGFAFDDRDHVPGYVKRVGMQTPGEFVYLQADSEESQAVLMIRNFVELTRVPGGSGVQSSILASEQTQYLLDKLWEKVC